MTRARLPGVMAAAVAVGLLSRPLPAAPESNPIVAVDVETLGTGRMIRIKTGHKPTFTVFRLSNPMRVVVDLSQGDLSRIEGPIAIEDGVLGQIAFREFRSNGMGIARITIGFEKDVDYDIDVEGNAVVLEAGLASQIDMVDAAPPPAKPTEVDPKRLNKARERAAQAAERARNERRKAETAAQRAAKKQAAAQRQAREAAALQKRARKARAEAQRLKEQARQAARRDREKAQAAWARAESRLQELDTKARALAKRRAEAERLAARARRTQREAEREAARAEADHKARVAELEKLKAEAEQEKQAARAARQRAEQAQNEAEQAQKQAAAAKAEADKARAETRAKLQAIAERERALEAREKRLATRQAELAEARRAFQQQQQRARARDKADTSATPRNAQGTGNSGGATASGTGESKAHGHEMTFASTTGARRDAPLRRRELVAKTRGRLLGIRARGAAVVLRTSHRPVLQTQRLQGPPRIVVDMEHTRKAVRQWRHDLEHALVQRVRLGPHGSTLRAVLDLRTDAVTHAIDTTEQGVVVRLKRHAEKPARQSRSDTDAPPAAPRASAAKRGKGGPAAAGMDPTMAARPSQRDAIGAVDFSRSGRTAVISIEVDPDVQAQVDDRSSKAWVLHLNGAQIPESLERSLDTSEYDTVVDLVSSYQANDRRVNVVANLSGAAKGALKRTDEGLQWRISGTDAAAEASARAPKTAGFATQGQQAARSTAPKQAAPKKRVNMRLKDASLVEVIRFIAEVTNQNIIIAEEVSGTVTVNLQNVPWDKALDVILKSKGYDTVRENGILRVAPLQQLQQEKEQALARKQAQQELEDPEIRLITVNYADAGEIVQQLKPLLSERGHVQVDARTNTIIAEDLARNLDKIVQLTKRLDKQTPQVLIEARIVEASSNFEQELGIQWGGVGQASSRTGNATGLQFPGQVVASGGADAIGNNPDGGVATPANYAVNLPAPIGVGAGGGIGFIFGSAGGGQILNLRLSALERNGEGRIVSSPRVTTLDNRTAKIAQGVDIPISVVSAAGTNTRFIPANLELEVTPHVTNDGSILMEIQTSKNEPDFARTGAQGDPTIIKKFAETEVLVKDGDTAVIGGIYTRNTSENYAEVPFFSKIPVLGWLFKKRRQEDRRDELLVFITPRIVNREESLVATQQDIAEQAAVAP